MKKKKIPLRLCLSCRLRKEKKSLIRIVASPTGEIDIDMTGKKPGRGAYICPKAECVARINRQLLSFALKTEVIQDDVIILQRAIQNLIESLPKEVKHGKN
ncbi:MAG: YlxR family protein [Candidatus Atribacteria bacterium]|nr:YlxR family protein [Candidatus Atribacteria bacterium]